MSLPIISLASARALHLAAQGLLQPLKRRAKPDDVAQAISQMGLLQIDTISVVARSPYLVLFSRLGDYTPAWLDQALASRQLFEYWAHEACFIPIEDYKLLRHRMLDPAAMGWKYPVQWAEQHQDAMTALLQHIEQHGPVRSADFSAGEKKGTGWWDWKPEKRHLESLFTAGEVMVAERRNFHRVYDLRQRILPHWDDKQHGLNREQAQQAMLVRSCQHLGLFKAAWLADYYRLKRVNPAALLAQLCEQGEIQPLRIDGLEGDFYLHQSLAPLLAQASNDKLRSTVTSLLSPFDPVVWDRRRALELFNFDYRLECYTPQAKRQYGYFTLPLLHRGALIGRIDAKMHRREGIFEIKALHLEAGIKLGTARCQDIYQAISRSARWHKATQVALGQVPAELQQRWGQGWGLSAPDNSETA